MCVCVCVFQTLSILNGFRESSRWYSESQRSFPVSRQLVLQKPFFRLVWLWFVKMSITVRVRQLLQFIRPHVNCCSLLQIYWCVNFVTYVSLSSFLSSLFYRYIFDILSLSLLAVILLFTTRLLTKHFNKEELNEIIIIRSELHAQHKNPGAFACIGLTL
jgi:hypothetical protein